MYLTFAIGMIIALNVGAGFYGFNDLAKWLGLDKLSLLEFAHRAIEIYLELSRRLSRSLWRALGHAPAPCAMP